MWFKHSNVEGRDIELENIVGHLLIAENQVERLRDRLANNIASEFRGVLIKNRKKSSTFVFYQKDGKWYEVSLNVECQCDNNDDSDDNYTEIVGLF